MKNRSMTTNLHAARVTRIVFLLLVYMFLSLNTYAVKKSVVVNEQMQEAEANVTAGEIKKPNLLQRLGLKILTKKLNKKVTRNNQEGVTRKTKLKKGMAIAAMILGILAFFTSILGILLAIIAIILGAIAAKRAKDQPEVYGGKGMAIAGLVLGIVALVLVLAVIAYIIWIGLI